MGFVDGAESLDGCGGRLIKIILEYLIFYF